MEFDIVSYIMGMANGKSAVEVDGNVVCTDDGEGNIVMTVDTTKKDGE